MREKDKERIDRKKENLERKMNKTEKKEGRRRKERERMSTETGVEEGKKGRKDKIIEGQVRRMEKYWREGRKEEKEEYYYQRGETQERKNR